MKTTGGASRFLIGATWDDAPHLSEATKAALYNSYQPFQRDARTRGIPQLGSGNVYQFSESEIKCDPFRIPKTWKRAYGLDAGGAGHATAATWGAFDPTTEILYLYDCYKRTTPEVDVHVGAVKHRGDLPGVADAARDLLTEKDAEQLILIYKRKGLDVVLPNKAAGSVEAGITEVWNLMTQGRFKVFSTLAQWWGEYRLYRRNERGQIVKKNDDLMDASRYLVRSGMKRAIPLEEEPTDKEHDPLDRLGMNNEHAWMS